MNSCFLDGVLRPATDLRWAGQSLSGGWFSVDRVDPGGSADCAGLRDCRTGFSSLPRWATSLPCSPTRCSTATTMVIRDTSGFSVGPTASEWMLNPRRENSDDTRASTPGLFSTRTDSVWRVTATSLLELLSVLLPGVSVSGEKSSPPTGFVQPAIRRRAVGCRGPP